ncbi:sucrose-6-phosphate hydrolase [Niallia circulans]|uniref:Sucrose-6-phosphate hydrolase n=1 Tax=Niallia circulans TaxID=1397 RepID=A0A553SJ68_NIACI|nr:sucrose-6-phosphate hydrolase [Niallia circulans]TRZ37033.1 sucrose-6-phosphate hydrolase [Niallia circulans]
MEWNREQRYRRWEDALEAEQKQLVTMVNQCSWRQSFHIQPVTGLLNDPNGFAYYNGEYHLFYQWFPLGPVHGLKNWYHTKSKDLVHWENVGVALEPTNEFDSHGVYSGSGIEHEGQLYFMYTGNSRNESWNRTPYQCLAVMNEKGQIQKHEIPVIANVPEGYTDHYRDPKVWKNGSAFFAVIGAQRSNETGTIVLYRSSDLTEWSLEGELNIGFEDFGYMWECPDYFEVDEHGILLFCPQGIPAEGDSYQNIYQSGYVLGDKLNIQERNLVHNGFQELDRGFDFYAPQTMEAPDGRRILVGWMGLPEIEYPTDKNGWAHCLSLPRELTVRNGKLRQLPVQELESLRGKKTDANFLIENETKQVEAFAGAVYELSVEFSSFTAEQFGVELRAGDKNKTILKYDTLAKKVVLDRSESGELAGIQYGTVREWPMQSETIQLQIFVDVSSVEVFVNDGEEVFTARIFPDANSQDIRFFAQNGKAEVKAIKYELNSDC